MSLSTLYCWNPWLPTKTAVAHLILIDIPLTLTPEHIFTRVLSQWVTNGCRCRCFYPTKLPLNLLKICLICVGVKLGSKIACKRSDRENMDAEMKWWTFISDHRAGFHSKISAIISGHYCKLFWLCGIWKCHVFETGTHCYHQSGQGSVPAGSCLVPVAKCRGSHRCRHHRHTRHPAHLCRCPAGSYWSRVGNYPWYPGDHRHHYRGSDTIT